MTDAVFYRHFAGDPFFNMAVDEWLLWRVSSEPGLVCLRLYTWQPDAITFGFSQRKELAMDFPKVSETPVIRRITGGRAIYHDPGELTYSIAVNSYQLDNPRLAGPLSSTSSSIAKALTCFLSRLGIQSQYLRHNSQENSGPSFFHSTACFDSIARYEIMANSQKIVASAQRRIGPAYVQHGSIKLHGVAPHPALVIKSLCHHSVKSIHPITREELSSMAALLVEEMGRFLGLRFEERSFSLQDSEEIASRAAFLKKNPLSRRNIFKHW